MRSAVVVLAWNAAEAVQACLHALQQLNPAADQIVVVDNGSHDGSADLVATQFPEVVLIRHTQNLGFALGMNAGIAHLLAQPAPPEVIVVLNQDTLVDPGWLAALLAVMESDAQIAAVGSQIRYPDGKLQHAGVTLAWPRGVAQHRGLHTTDHYQSGDYVTGAALALRSTALQQVGLFDPGYTPAYYEDVDLCWRLRQAGYQIRYAPAATLVHQESLSISDPITRSAYYNRGRLRFVIKTYAWDDLIGVFAQAEMAFVRQYAHTFEGTVLRWAYDATLDTLDAILADRQAIGMLTPTDAHAQLTRILIGLRRALFHSLYRRSIAAVNTLASL
ncbi:glycosyl transferase family protein [Oscillochloris trichoides DG-6]|uniref:Glycosyl transferase family protein n=1 Tax=Oscillochloris trichoides DG-6 TaxID=765420 RepID=E1IC02_9CHLR|nr:glycosyl transferase family protein [Oscillochloris trichoides DG-6]